MKRKVKNVSLKCCQYINRKRAHSVLCLQCQEVRSSADQLLFFSQTLLGQDINSRPCGSEEHKQTGSVVF